MVSFEHRQVLLWNPTLLPVPTLNALCFQVEMVASLATGCLLAIVVCALITGAVANDANCFMNGIYNQGTGQCTCEAPVRCWSGDVD